MAPPLPERPPLMEFVPFDPNFFFGFQDTEVIDSLCD